MTIEGYTNFLWTYQNVPVIFLVYQQQSDDFKGAFQEKVYEWSPKEEAFLRLCSDRMKCSYRTTLCVPIDSATDD